MRLGASSEGPERGDDVVVMQYPTATELASGSASRSTITSYCSTRPRRTATCANGSAPGVAPERHLAYAGQWLALAIGAVAAAIVMTYRTVRRKT